MPCFELSGESSEGALPTIARSGEGGHSAALFANLAGMVYRCRNDQARTMEFVSEGCRSLTGHEPADLVDNRTVSFAQLIHPEDRQRVWTELQAALVSKEPFQLAYRLVRRDGEERGIWEQGSGVFSPEGAPFAVEGFIIDVTEHRRTARALQESEQRYRSIAEDMPALVCRFLPDGTLIYVNSAYCRYFRKSREELVGHDFFQFIPWEERERVRSQFRALSPERPSITYEHQASASDGTTRYQQWTDRVLYTDQNQPQEYQSLGIDITERKKAERDLQIDLSLQCLRNVILQMQREEDWGEVVRTFHEEIKKWISFNACSINIIDFGKGTLTAYAVGPRRGAHLNVRGSMVPAILEALKTAMETGRPFYRRNRRDPLFAERLPPEVNAVVDIPFVGGTVAINSTCEDAFTEQDFKTLGRFAQVISQGYRRLEDLRALAESEARFRQAQKLEAVGQLAGGVAHDFNNLLTVISGYCELFRRRTGDAALAPEAQADVEEIRKAVQRGSALVRQLLAFSRRQVFKPEVLNLNILVADLEKMLHRLLGEGIELHLSLAQSLNQVLADAGQLQQVLLNLAANARDAMPGGGRLVIESANMELDEGHVREGVAVQAGPYVKLVVRDTGIGMDEYTRSHVFEPFFTTKEPDKGTGLGLSTVYGIIKQSEGYIWVSSEPGQGAAFEVYLPRVPETVKPSPRPASAPRSSVLGTETILVVDDDENLRPVVRRMLELQGYAVLEAARGKEAFQLASEQPGAIHLLLTDVAMPEMNGRELADALTAIHPETKVLFMSGYAQGVIDRQGVLKPGTAFLQKPFTLDTLSQMVREVLD